MAFPVHRGLPRAVRLILINALIGAGVGAFVAAAMVAPAGLGLGRLMLASSEPWIAAALLFSGMMGTFAGLSAATAVMLTVKRPPNDGAGGAY